MKATSEPTGFASGRRTTISLVPPDEFASIAEVAGLLGVKERTAQRYAERTDFPQPADVVAGGRIRVWRRSDVEAWGAEKLPLRTGRPPKSSPDT